MAGETPNPQEKRTKEKDKVQYGEVVAYLQSNGGNLFLRGEQKESIREGYGFSFLEDHRGEVNIL